MRVEPDGKGEHSVKGGEIGGEGANFAELVRPLQRVNLFPLKPIENIWKV